LISLVLCGKMIPKGGMKMQENNDFIVDYYARDEKTVTSAFTKVFIWMFVGLLVTGVTALATVSIPALFMAIFTNNVYFYGLLIAEVVLVILLSARLTKMSKTAAIVSFLLYAVINGLTLSSIFILYTLSSIASVFFITAGMFGVMAVYGYTTKSDLTKMGSILLMALVGLIIAGIVQLIWPSNTLSLILAFIGIIVFCGLTAYDIQRIKAMSSQFTTEDDFVTKFAIFGALMIYLDFINIFLKLLRLLGSRRD